MHEGPKKQRQKQEDEGDLKEWLNEHIKQTILQNMEVAEIARDRYSTFEADDLGASPFSQEVRKFSLLEKFSVPRFVPYNGTSDPATHL